MVGAVDFEGKNLRRLVYSHFLMHWKELGGNLFDEIFTYSEINLDYFQRRKGEKLWYVFLGTYFHWKQV